GFFKGAAVEAEFFDYKLPLNHPTGPFYLLSLGLWSDRLRLQGSFRAVAALTRISARKDLFCDPLVHLAGLVHNRQTRRTAGVDRHRQCLGNWKQGHQHRPQDGAYNEKLRTHSLNVFTLNNGEEFSHATS